MVVTLKGLGTSKTGQFPKKATHRHVGSGPPQPAEADSEHSGFDVTQLRRKKVMQAASPVCRPKEERDAQMKYHIYEAWNSNGPTLPCGSRHIAKAAKRTTRTFPI
jgi:hypothetical protein